MSKRANCLRSQGARVQCSDFAALPGSAAASKETIPYPIKAVQIWIFRPVADVQTKVLNEL